MESKILAKIKELSRKDPASAAVSIGKLPDDKKRLFEELLSTVVGQSGELNKEVKKRENEKVRSKAEEEGRFIGNLKAKVDGVENEAVRVKTNFADAREKLLGHLPTSMEDLKPFFNGLMKFISDLDVLKVMGRYRLGEVLLQAMEYEELTIIRAAAEFDIQVHFAERLVNFTQFVGKYPTLLISGYSFETILKYKTAIVKAAEEDENFASRLEMEVDYIFEGHYDDEDELLNDADMPDSTNQLPAAAAAAARSFGRRPARSN